MRDKSSYFKKMSVPNISMDAHGAKSVVSFDVYLKLKYRLYVPVGDLIHWGVRDRINVELIEEYYAKG